MNYLFCVLPQCLHFVALLGILPKQSLQEVKVDRCSLKYNRNNKLPRINETNILISVDLSPK